MKLKRRSLLGGALALGGSAGLCQVTGTSRAAAFGRTPSASPALPAKAQVGKVLEVFLYGGVTTWESFYAVEEFGRVEDPDPARRRTQLYSFYEPGKADSPLLAALRTCKLASNDIKLVPFARDSAGRAVNFGPLLAPLLGRADVLARTRVVVTAHTLEPHEAAIPLAISGRAVGSASLACLGAHIQRYFLDRAGTTRKTPLSYTLASGDLDFDNLRATTASGFHPGSARPLLLNVDNATRLTTLLERNTIGSDRAEAYDSLLRTYVDQYSDRLRFSGQGDPLRSARLQDLNASAANVAGAKALTKILDPRTLRLPMDTLCDVVEPTANVPAAALKLAGHLLDNPVESARYCLFVDPGLVSADGGGGYDSHGENSLTQTRNLNNTLSRLLSIIREPDESSADSPGKISLDDTLVILNMEFGRSPGSQDGGMGRNHWPYGYVTVYLGGPVTQEHRGIQGAIGPDGKAIESVSPTEHRIAALLSMGIWPFSHEAFGVSDVPGAKTEQEAVESVLSRVWGYG